MSSYSSLKTLTSCAWLRVLNSYFKKVPVDSEALKFGHCYHTAIEKGLEEGIRELRANHLHNKEELLIEMVKRFKRFIVEHGIEIIEHEVAFEITLEGNEENPYVGYIDAVVKYNNEIYLAEFKTAGSISYHHVEVDSQLTSYLWACKKLDIYNPKGILWICNKKSMEKQPVILKGNKLSVAKNQGCSYRAYSEKAKEIYGDDIPAGIQTFMDWLKENDNPPIVMVVTTRTEEQINRYEEVIKKLLPQETALLKTLKDDGILEARDQCLCFPTQQCMQMCHKKDICLQLLKSQKISEGDVEAYRDLLIEEAGGAEDVTGE